MEVDANADAIVSVLHDAADALAACEVDGLPAAELHRQLMALTGAAERLDAGIARLAARWDASGQWADDGSKSAAARLARETGMAFRTAADRLRTARAATQMPYAQQAWLEGRLTEDAVRLLGRARGGGRSELFRRHEEVLVDTCAGLRLAQAERVVRYWMRRADAELGADGATPVERFVHLDVTFRGAVSIDGVLDPVGGAEVQEALRRIERELYRDDQRTNASRTHGERMADAMVEMARRAMSSAPDARRPQPLVTIIAGEASMAQILELSNGAVVHPVDVAPHAARSLVQAFVYSAGIPIRGTAQRTFGGMLRRAIQVRDRRCQHPSGCDEPMTRCDVDHIVPFSQGGPTEPWNGRLLCEVHDRHDELRNRSPDSDPGPYPDVRRDPPPDAADGEWGYPFRTVRVTSWDELNRALIIGTGAEDVRPLRHRVAEPIRGG